MNTALIVFAKAPLPGQAKTRLIPALGAAGAATLAACMLQHALAAAAAARPQALQLCTTPDTGHPAIVHAAAQHGAARFDQGPGDLGQRMHRALARALAGHDAALLMGTDAPALDAARLRQAMAALDSHDAVFVPALDGGYALIGLRRPQPSLFADIPWSSAEVMPRTRQRLLAAGLRWAELDAVADVDEPADLVHVPAAWLDRVDQGRPGADRG